MDKILARVVELENEGYQFEAAQGSFDLLVKKCAGTFRPHFERLNFHVNVEADAAGERGRPRPRSSCASATRSATKWPRGTARSTRWTPPCARPWRRPFPNLANMHLVDYKVRVINSEAGTAAGVRVVIESRDEHDVWGTVGVSENMIEASWIALVDSFEYKLCKDEATDGDAASAAGWLQWPTDRHAADLGRAFAAVPCVAAESASISTSQERVHVRSNRPPTNSPSNTTTPRRRARWYPFWEEQRLLSQRARSEPQAVHDRHSAAERDRRAAPGPRAEQHAARHSHPLASGCRATTPCGCRAPIMPASPRRPSSSGGCWRKKRRPGTTWAAKSWSSASGPGRTSTRRAFSASCKQMGCSCDWQRTRFTLDDSLRPGRAAHVLQLVQGGADLSRQAAGELGHVSANGRQRRRSVPRDGGRPLLAFPLSGHRSAARRADARDDRHHAARDDARRHGRGRASRSGAGARPRRSRACARSWPRPARSRRPSIEAQLDELAERRRTLLPQLDPAARHGPWPAASCMLPLVNREIPLVADEWAKPELGSGCVKITPAHDPNDYDVGQRQNLPMINIMNPDGTLNANAGPYQGLTIAKARERVVADLEALGLVEKVEDREIELAHSDRSKTPIEPYLADQWFVRMERPGPVGHGRRDRRPREDRSRRATPAAISIGSAKSATGPSAGNCGGDIGFRSGTRRPRARTDLQSAFAGRDDVVWQRDAEHDRWLICAQEVDLAGRRDPGPQARRRTPTCSTPGSARRSGRTRRWAGPTRRRSWRTTIRPARWSPAATSSRCGSRGWCSPGLHNVGDVPFREVFIHPKILDGYGERMSKSKGNGVDPLDVIDKFGADCAALRPGLPDDRDAGRADAGRVRMPALPGADRADEEESRAAARRRASSAARSFRRNGPRSRPTWRCRAARSSASGSSWAAISATSCGTPRGSR